MHRYFFQVVAAFAVALSMSFSAMSQSKGFDTSFMNTSVSPCEDFFEFANGTWLKNTEIPAAESRWGTFNILADRNNEILRDILEGAAKKPGIKDSDTQLIGDFYSTCMDEATIERLGTKPIEPILKEIAALSTAADVRRQIARMHLNGLPSVFSFSAGPDLKDADVVIVNAFQAGLSMPNRDYYTNTDDRSKETREKFTAYVRNMFKLLGDNEAAAAENAATVLKLQTRLANASLAQVELRNPDNRYNKVTLEDAQKLTPGISWEAYFTERNVKGVNGMNIAPAKFFQEASAMIGDVPVSEWKTYFRWMTVNAAAPYLPKAFADENFEFFGKFLSGQKERQPRWKTCVQNTNSNLGEAVGMEYVRRQFKPEAKARMDELIDNLMAAMKERIDNLEWMSADTKKQAQAKLSTFKRKIGYPDKLRGYKGLSIGRSSYAGNILSSNRFQAARNLEDLGKPRDKTRWGFTPSTVNASYSSVNNEITFPAGILQPPFFNFEADDAINYGAIGGVIGHEITHGFDDSGSRFDADGNLKMWWTPDDRAKFEERASCVVDQFNKYEVQPNLFINGKLTLGENIGDFAGLTVAYDAFMRSLKGKPRPENIDGFTPEQRFFLGWARVWAGKYRQEAEVLQVRTNTHSLPKWRVNGPLSNMPQFRQAFGCKDGNAMIRKNSCSVW